MTEDKVDLLAEALRARAGQTGGAATPMAPISAGRTDRIQATEPAMPATGWILLLAILLGLATGTVIGLLTVL